MAFKQSGHTCDMRAKLDFIDFSAPEYDYVNFDATALTRAPRLDAKP